MIHGHDARLARLDHADRNAGAQSHFVEPTDQMRVAVDIANAAGFAAMEQGEREDLRHGGEFEGDFKATEIQSQFDLYSIKSSDQ